jgi:hypothetical protein
MPVLCITCDLDPDDPDDHEDLLACLCSLGRHRRITSSTWLVDTEHSAGSAVRALDAFNGPGDKIVVFTVAVGQKWSMLCGEEVDDAATAAWLRAHVHR